MKSTPLPPRTRAALPAPTGVPCLPPSDGPPIPGSCRGEQGEAVRAAQRTSELPTNAPPPAACAWRPGAVGGCEGQRETLAPADMALPRESDPGPAAPSPPDSPGCRNPRQGTSGPAVSTFLPAGREEHGSYPPRASTGDTGGWGGKGYPKK